MDITIVQIPESKLAKTNRVYVSNNSQLKNKIVVFDGSDFCYFAEGHSQIQEGTIGLSLIHRKSHMFELNKKVRISVISKLESLDVVQCSLSILNSKTLQIDCEEFENAIVLEQIGQPLTEGQSIHFPWDGVAVTINVSTVAIIEENRGLLSFLDKIPTTSGIITDKTKFIFQSETRNIKLKNSISSVGNKLFKKDINLTELGIGGLNEEFNTIFRTAFATRAIPKVIAEKMKLKHRKGMVLYGPPGTGKTLIARQIAKLLNCKPENIRVINGPEVLNKYVGGSEENVREIFARAEADMRNDEDELHVIIFDEADALFKKRGSRSDSTGVNDNVVNQILAKIDGVDSLNNILIIAMTNRKDSIDDAILRSGRLDIHIEVGLPDEKGRVDILNIHTTNIKDRLAQDVNLIEIAKLTRNYTGAELENIVVSATSFAITRELDMSDLKKTDVNPIITQTDFLNALTDVPTLFGKISDEIKQITTTPFVDWSDHLSTNRFLIKESIENLKSGNVLSIVLTGSTGIGKTKYISHIIKDLNIACVKMISPEALLRTSNIQNLLTEMVDACGRAEISVLFLDGFERLVKWSKYGYKYDNDTLQIIMALLRLTQKPNKKLIVFCTANDPEVLQNLDIYEMFDMRIEYQETISYSNIEKYFPQVVQNFEENEKINDIHVTKIMKMIKYE